MPDRFDNPISTAKARDHFSELINRAAFGGERIVLTRRGKPLAAIVPVEDLQLMDEFETPEDTEAIRAAHEDMKHGRLVPLDEVMKDFGIER